MVDEDPRQGESRTMSGAGRQAARRGAGARARTARSGVERRRPPRRHLAVVGVAVVVVAIETPALTRPSSPGPYRREVGRFTHRAERGDQLRGEDREMPARGPACSTMSGRPGSPVSVRIVSSVGNTARWKSWSQIVEREAEVDVLGSVELVVDAVVVRADEDPLEGPEAQAGCSSARRRRSRRRRRAR